MRAYGMAPSYIHHHSQRQPQQQGPIFSHAWLDSERLVEPWLYCLPPWQSVVGVAGVCGQASIYLMTNLRSSCLESQPGFVLLVQYIFFCVSI